MIVIKDKTMHLVYSEDESSYYWQRLSDWRVSQSFGSARLAIIARQNNKIIWK